VISTLALVGLLLHQAPVQRMRLLNKIAVALDLPTVYPGLKDLDESVC
jgi:hypothetical protein